MGAQDNSIHQATEEAVSCLEISDQSQTPSSLQPLALEEQNERRAPRTKLRIVAILLALYLALFIAALDHTVIATSIPTIAAQLHSSIGYAWIASAYLLADAAAGPVWAKFSDIWGRKLALLGAVVLFAVASVIAALSHSVNMLIAARALQGTAAGGLIQLVNITISDLFSMRERTLYLGMVNLVWGISGGLGPLVGGGLTEYASWRWCFWINLPICGTSFVLLLLFLDVWNPRTPLRAGIVAFDWMGTVLIVAVVVMLLLGLEFGGIIFPWSSPTIICLIVFGVILAGVFLFTEKRIAKYPLMPFQIFQNRSSNAAFAVCFCHGMVFIAAAYYLPLFWQSVKHRSPLQSGALILPHAITEAGMGVVNGIIMLKTGHYREIIWVGLALLSLAMGLYITLEPDIPTARVIGFEIISGIGSGCLFEAPMVALQAVTTQDDTAAATATFGFFRNLATAMSLVLGSVVFSNGMDKQTGYLRDAGVNGTLLDALSDGRAQANVDIIRTIPNATQREAVEAAFAWSLRNMWIMYLALGVLGLCASAFIAHNNLSTEHTETKTGLREKVKGIVHS